MGSPPQCLSRTLREWFSCKPSNRWSVVDANMNVKQMGTNGSIGLFSQPPPLGDGQMKMGMGLNTHIKFAL